MASSDNTTVAATSTIAALWSGGSNGSSSNGSTNSSSATTSGTVNSSGGLWNETVTATSAVLDDLALPIENVTSEAVHATGLAATGGNKNRAPPQSRWVESSDAEKTAALVMVISLLVTAVLFTIAYLVYQRYTCKVTRRRKKAKEGGSSMPMKNSATAITIAGGAAGAGRSDPQASEALVPAVPDAPGNKAASSSASGPQLPVQQQSIAKNWYNSAILQYAEDSPRI